MLADRQAHHQQQSSASTFYRSVVSAGACGIAPSTLYDVYVVAQDFATPTPNLQAVPIEKLLNTSDTSGGFNCTAGAFVSKLRPNIVPATNSPGLPASQLYGNWTATR